MKRFVSLILSVCFLFSINTVSYAANISSRKASNPVIQSMNDKYHVDFRECRFMIGPNALATAAHNLYSIKEKPTLSR